MHDDHSTHTTPVAMLDHLIFPFLLAACLGAGYLILEFLHPFTVPQATVLLTLLPLLAFANQMLIGRFLPRKGDWVSLSAIFASCVLSVWIFMAVVRGGEPQQAQIEWFRAGEAAVRIGVYVDGLTAGMLFIVTFIGGLIHLYSVGYMHGDPRYGRFFGFLSIFCFSMLGLVVTDNLLLLYVFWELVGLSSYLLIGFWFEKDSAAEASKKAFLTNRVGDIGFFLGLATLYKWTGTFNFTEIFDKLPGLLEGGVPTWKLSVVGLLVFCGAVGKSAQFPLHVWLPDAMEGPTPVSALIHAATMVAAGVYMVGRLYPIFTPDAFLGIALIGLITAFFAGTIAIAQNDIKRVLAYSTVSQLGYMMIALGVGGYTAGLFHLSTHAFFKALLFLCSGSVIHAVHSQDMRQMGGLWKKIPVTFCAMLMGTLAICGVPFTSGFYSKDAILEAAWEFGQGAPLRDGLAWVVVQKGIFWLALLAAGVTAFYSFRLIWMTFFGEPRDRRSYDRAHESPIVMTAPLVILAVFAFAMGFGFEPPKAGERHRWAEATNRQAITSAISRPELALGWGTWYPGLVERPQLKVVEIWSRNHGRPWAGMGEEAAPGTGEGHSGPGEAAVHPAPSPGHAPAHAAAKMPFWLPIAVVLLGVALSVPCFLYRTITLETIEESVPALGRPLRWLHRVLENKYYVDELYHLMFVTPLLVANNVLWWIDANIIDGFVNWWSVALCKASDISGRIDLYFVDGLVNFVADTSLELGNRMRRFQTGMVQGYLVHSLWVVVVALVVLRLFAGS